MSADQPGVRGDESEDDSSGAAPLSEDAAGWATHGTRIRPATPFGTASASDGATPGAAPFAATSFGPSDYTHADDNSDNNSDDESADDESADDESEDDDGSEDDDEANDEANGKKKRRWSNDGCWGCDGVDCGDWNLGCDLPGCDLLGCHLMLPGLTLSTLLLVAAAVLPERGAGWLVRALITGYRRHITRLTPACPQTPSCSEYALASVATLGVRRGLAAAAHRIRGCRRPDQPALGGPARTAR
jgi:hypothetical protein